MRTPVRSRLRVLGQAAARVRRVLNLAAEFRIGRLGFGGLIAGSVLAGFAEAGVLALVAYTATSMSGAGAGVDTTLGGFSLARFTIPALLWVGLGLGMLRLLLQLALAYLPARMTADLQTTLRLRLATGFVRASWEAQTEVREGQFDQVLGQQANRAATVVLSVATGAAGLCVFVTLIASAFVVNAIAAGLAVVSAAALFAVLRPLNRVTRKEANATSRGSVDVSGDTVELVRLAEETHTLGVGEARMRMMAHAIDDLSGHFFKTRLYLGATAPLYQAAVLALMIGGLAGIYALESRSIAALGAVVLMLIRALAYSQNVQTAYQQLSEQLPSLELVRSQIQELEANQAATSGDETLDGLAEIEFRGVGFRYVASTPVLDGVNLRIRAGESVGIIGPSGAGKSTLLQLLIRLREPSAGQVLVNGVPAGRFSRSSWFDQIGFVPQEARLLSGTVAENIRFLREGISDDDVVAAARFASVHDEIEQMPLGYATPIGQRADAVSGGQRQRIALARALVGRPSMLVLDEPTSSLDLRSDAAVSEALQSLRGRTTLVLVTHRLSTLSICDRVLVLDGGSLVAEGTADELFANSPFFRQIVELSSQG